MNALPAKAAGCERVVIGVPAPDGQVAPLLLLSAELAGVDEVVVVADAPADPEHLAADPLAQAEHDAVTQSVLATDLARWGRRIDECRTMLSAVAAPSRGRG